jgi:hypothetical protein
MHSVRIPRQAPRTIPADGFWALLDGLAVDVEAGGFATTMAAVRLRNLSRDIASGAVVIR